MTAVDDTLWTAELERFRRAVTSQLDITLDPLPQESGYFGFRVRQFDGPIEVWVIRMLLNWRIQETYDNGWPAGRYWCYLGTGTHTFAVAATHAALYGTGEPDGWIKAWDGRTNYPWETNRRPSST